MMNAVKPNNANVLSNRYASPEMATPVSYTHLTLPTKRIV